MPKLSVNLPQKTLNILNFENERSYIDKTDIVDRAIQLYHDVAFHLDCDDKIEVIKDDDFGYTVIIVD